MGIILKTTTLALLLMGGNDDIEKKVKHPAFTSTSENTSKYIVIQGKTYRQRPPRASCDPTLYGTPIKEEPQKLPPLGPLYFGIGLAAVIFAATTVRKKHDAIIEKYQPPRDWDFYNTRSIPIVDYEIEREGRDSDSF